MKRKGYLLLWLCILVTAFFIRVEAALFWNRSIAATPENGTYDGRQFDGPFFYGDSDSYWKLGRALAFCRPYEFDERNHWQIFRMPGYPAVLAPLFLIFGEYPPTIAARLEGAVFGVLNVALVGWLALTVFGQNTRGRRVAALAALFITFDPTETAQSVSILSEEPFATLSLLQLIVLIKAVRRLKIISEPAPEYENRITNPRGLIGWSLLLAFCSTGAIYMRPSWYYFITFTAFLFFVWHALFGLIRRSNIDPRLIANALINVVLLTFFTGVFSLLLLSPWIYRNYRLTGCWIPSTLQMGASLYDGLSPNATGASDMCFVDVYRQDELLTPSDSPDVHIEVRMDNRLKAESLRWIKAHHREVARLACVKFYRLWTPFPRENAFKRPLFTTVMFASWIVVLLPGFTRFVQIASKDDTEWLLAVPALYVTAMHVIFVSSIRYRVPVMYGIAILSASWFISQLETIQIRRPKEMIPDNGSSATNPRT